MRNCYWTEDQDDGSWVTDCGNKFTLNNGTPSKNGMEYCCYCGDNLIVKESTQKKGGK